MFDELRVKHEKCFQKGEGWELLLLWTNSLGLHTNSQLCLMEGLIFYHFTSLNLNFQSKNA